MTEFFVGLGDFFTETFKVLPMLGNMPNYLFIGVTIAMFFYWMNELVKYKKSDSIE